MKCTVEIRVFGDQADALCHSHDFGWGKQPVADLYWRLLKHIGDVGGAEFTWTSSNPFEGTGIAAPTE